MRPPLSRGHRAERIGNGLPADVRHPLQDERLMGVTAGMQPSSKASEPGMRPPPPAQEIQCRAPGSGMRRQEGRDTDRTDGRARLLQWEDDDRPRGRRPYLWHAPSPLSRISETVPARSDQVRAESLHATRVVTSAPRPGFNLECVAINLASSRSTTTEPACQRYADAHGSKGVPTWPRLTSDSVNRYSATTGVGSVPSTA